MGSLCLAAAADLPRMGPGLLRAGGPGSDFDFLPGLLAGPADLYHPGISHSLGFAVLCGGLCAALGAWRGGWREGGRCGLVGGGDSTSPRCSWITRGPTSCALRGAALVAPGRRQSSPYPFLVQRYQRWPWTWAKVWHKLRAAGWETLVLGLPGLWSCCTNGRATFLPPGGRTARGSIGRGAPTTRPPTSPPSTRAARGAGGPGTGLGDRLRGRRSADETFGWPPGPRKAIPGGWWCASGATSARPRP